LPPKLEFPESDGFGLIRIEQALDLSLHPLLALQELFGLRSEGGERVLFALRPALVELRQEGRSP
jgi:hypothetical protein